MENYTYQILWSNLRWLQINSFQHFPRQILKGQIITALFWLMPNSWYQKSAHPIAKYVAVNFVAQWVTRATIWSAKNTLNFSFKLL